MCLMLRERRDNLLLSLEAVFRGPCFPFTGADSTLLLLSVGVRPRVPFRTPVFKTNENNTNSQ